MKALFMYDYGKENFDKIRNLGYEIKVVDENHFDKESLDYDSDVLCCYNPFENLDIEKFTNLKLIQLSSIGFDFVPKEKLISMNIPLAHNKGGYSIPMGEWIVLNILQLAKNSRGFIEKQQEKRWKMDLGIMEITGKNIVFLGTGTIAKEGAKRLQGFDVNIIGVNTKGREAEFFHKVYPIEKVEEAIEIADFLVMVLPSTAKTENFMNHEKFKLMKKDAFFINVSRGKVVDEQALFDALKNQSIKGAALDVFESEPLSKENPLWDLKNIYITPHNSWISQMKDERRFNLIYENLKRLKEGKELLNIVDLDRGY